MKLCAGVLVVLAVVSCKKDSGEAEVTALADAMCACRDMPCITGTMERFTDWERRFPKQADKGPAVDAMVRITDCMKAKMETLNAQAATPPAPAPIDAAVAPPIGAAVAVVPPVDPAPPPAANGPLPPIEGRPPGVTDAQIAKLDAVIETLRAMDRELKAVPDDCKAATAIVLKYWKGFVPLKKVMRAANPKHDPAIDTWFEQGYLRRGLGAMGGFIANYCDTPEWAAATDKQDFLGMKTVH